MSTDEKIARLPFSQEASEQVERLDGDLLFHERTKSRALNRIFASLKTEAKSVSEDALEDEEYSELDVDPYDVELVSYPLSRILVSLTGEFRIVNRFIQSETEEFSDILTSGLNSEGSYGLGLYSDESLISSLDEVNNILGTNIEQVHHSQFFKSVFTENYKTLPEQQARLLFERIIGDTSADSDKADSKADAPGELSESFLLENVDNDECNVYKVDVHEYLQPNSLFRSPKYALRHMVVENGYVYMSVEVTEAFIEAKVREKVSHNLPLPEEQIEPLRESFESEVEQIIAFAPDQMDSADIGDLPVDIDLFPPSMKKIVTKWRNGNIDERMLHVTLGTFLIKLGMTNEEIMDMLETPPVARDTAEYQLSHLRDGDYMVPNFSKIQSYGLNWEMDELEETVANPLPYYKIKVQSETEDGEDHEDSDEDGNGNEDAEADDDEDADSQSGGESSEG